MSSATENLPLRDSLSQQQLEHSFVDEQIHRTRRALKTVDLVAGLIALAIGVLSYLLTMAILEHWVVPGGLSSSVRALLLMVLVVGVCWYSWRIFWPLVSQPINPVYAAQTIEQGSPSLKNSLLNLLLLRDRRRQISRQVYQAIEHQAAQRLSQVPVDSAVDRSAILRLGYILVGVVAMCSLYQIFSPKDPIASAGRLLLPWADIPVPSRVQIENVEPGDVSAARGEQLIVSAEILGKREEEIVRLIYSQVDGQVVDQEIIMTGDERSFRFESRLPGRISVGGRGIQSDLVYRIEAGDARSPDYRVSVFSQPTLVVERVRYEYPSYTRYPPREEGFTGDISAVEGTTVTLYAVANQPIKSAHVDFEADGKHDLLMNAEDAAASVRFPLELKPDRRTPMHQSYVLRYINPEGRKNPSPPKYQIDVQRDYSPEVELLEPREEILEVGLNDEVVIKLQARDPDFALRNVALLGEVGGERVLKESLLSSEHSGRFDGQLKIVPADLDLQEGDVLEYWAAAADNRRPEPNLAFTKHQKLRIIGEGSRDPLPDGEQQDQSGEGQQGEGGDQGGEGQQSEGQEGNAGGEGTGSQEGEGEDQQEGTGGGGQQGESGQGEQQDQQGGAGQDQQDSASEGAANNAAENEGQGNPDQQTESEPGQGESGNQPSGGQEPVSPDGDNDGEAFERIADHFDEKEQSEGSENSDGSETGREQQQQNGEGQQDPQEPGQMNQQPGDQNQQPDAQQDGNTTNEQPQGQPGEGQQGESNQADSAEQTQQQEGPSEQQSPAGEGAQGEGQQQEASGQEDQGGDQQKGDSPAGEMSKEQGQQGAGNNPGENQGAPNADGAKKPNDKQPDGNDRSQLDEQEAPMDSKSSHESDSQGGQGGDRSGGGQEGAGQQADEQGTGAAGEHQSAEDGAGESPEQGEGETGQQAGDQQKADRETGQSSGDQPGEGSQQGEQAGGEQQGDSQDGSESASDQGSSSSSPSETSGTPEGGGTGSNEMTAPPSGETQPGDDANLDYARKQTDLVLDKLEDQLENKQVDQELLDKLGWTANDLKRFVNRWKNLKKKAEGNSPEAQAAADELNISLQSLGFNAKERNGFDSTSPKDTLRNLRESFRGRTPMEYEELMRKYVKGTASANEGE